MREHAPLVKEPGEKVAISLNGGYSDLVLTLDRRYLNAPHSWILELKYIKVREATDARVSAALDRGDGQPRAYLADERLEAVKGPGGWKRSRWCSWGPRRCMSGSWGERVVLRREEEEREGR